MIWSKQGQELYEDEIRNGVFDYVFDLNGMMEKIEKNFRETASVENLYFEHFKKEKLIKILKS